MAGLRSTLGKLVQEPLLQFLAAGACIFALYTFAGSPGDPGTPRIVVSEGRVQQLAQVFTRTWQRQPTPKELQGLIEAFVKEEIYYREAVKLGLDRDDTLVRRRMQQKMEFLSEPPESDFEASEEELAAFLEKNRVTFRVEPQVAFRQIFINPKKGEVPAEDRAKRILARLAGPQTAPDASQLGDRTLLPQEVPLSTLSRTARSFGDAFAREIVKQPLGEWSGPIHSAYGLHLVRVGEFREGYDPPLAEVRDAVEKKWRTARRDVYTKAAYEKLRNRYEVILPPEVAGR